VVDDDEAIRFVLKRALQRKGYEVRCFENVQSIKEALETGSPGAILTDIRLPDADGLSVVDTLERLELDCPVIAMTAFSDLDQAVSAYQKGVFEYLPKPFDLEQVISVIERALATGHVTPDKGDESSGGQLLGESKAMQEVFRTIGRLSRSDISVLITGETGSGKEVVARVLHQHSPRATAPFVAINTAAIPAELLESELFGHEKGAFTDAHKMKQGRFEIASSGTLFLDEIGNLTYPLQSKLLTVLERREITRVGSTKPIPIDVRMICATNNNIHQDVADGVFRQDLLYRINTVEVHLPALRDRSGDIPLLADHFLKIYSRKYRKPIRNIQSSAIKKLNQYSWPGNVRELQHAIERAVIMCDGSSLGPDDFILSSGVKSSGGLELESYNLEDIEKTIIEKVLKTNQGNVTQAATQLGLTRTSLYRRMEKHGL
jgi:DNA-binding NtrC family response regulator